MRAWLRHLWNLSGFLVVFEFFDNSEFDFHPPRGYFILRLKPPMSAVSPNTNQ
jgi:hypothetical protein